MMSTHPSEPPRQPMSEPPPSRKAATQAMARLMDRLADVQVHKPWIPLLAVMALSALFGWLASHLELRTRYDQLLPESQPSVIELKRVEKRTNVAQTVMVLLEGDDPATLEQMGDAIVPKLEALGPETVSSAEDGIQAARQFLQPRAGFFVDKDDLLKTQADVDARWDWEVQHASGFAIDDADEPPKLDRDVLRARFEGKAKERLKNRKVDQYRNGYYERADGKALVVLARSPVAAGDLVGIQTAVDKMKGVVNEVHARPEFQKVHVSYAGDMVTGLFEYGSIKSDLLSVGTLGIGLVLSVVLLYFMRVRALVVMGITIACGLAWTFGATRIAIGHLNIATGFLFSIVAGNGINVGIIYLARYYEEKRKGASTPTAIRVAHRTTWPSTVVAAIAAAASYSSLGVTDFKAFKHFAFIGAAGMIICWFVTVTMLPTLLVLIDRSEITMGDEKKLGAFAKLRAQGVPYGRFFAALVPKAPRLFVALGAMVAVAGTALAVRYVARDPMEYDLSKVQNDKAQRGELNHAWDEVNAILGLFPGSMVVMADTAEEARELTEILQKRWDEAPADSKPFEAVHSIWEFIPKDQEAKLPALLDIADKLVRAHDKHIISEEDWKEIQPYLPPEDLKPYGLDDLPESLARPFTERDGKRGTLVLIEPSGNQSTDDLHYLIRYSDSFRETKLSNGKVLRGSGRAVIFADILSAVVGDIPKAVSLSLLMTLLAVFVTFRRGSHSASVLATLLVGLAGVAGFLALTDVKINFLNFAALPITFGIGVDYGVNVMQRYHADGSSNILGALRTTGGAVVLCSLTTTLGYFALIGSHNQAIRSLGVVAVVGEISCLLAAVVVLPAGWYLVERRRGPSPLVAPRVPKL